MANSSKPAAGQNLLNLLNFSSQQDVSSTHKSRLSPQSETNNDLTQRSGQQRSISASDLVARLMSPPNETHSQAEFTSDGENLHHNAGAETTTSNPLLDLLNRQSSVNMNTESEGERERENRTVGVKDSLQRTRSPMRIFGSVESRENTPFEAPMTGAASVSSPPIFTYSNPFEALKASRTYSPRMTKSPTLVAEKTDITHSIGATTTKLESNSQQDSQSFQEVQNGVESAARSCKPSYDVNGKAISSNYKDVEIEQTSQIATETILDSKPLSHRDMKEMEPESSQPRVSASGLNDSHDVSGEWEDIQETSGRDESARIVPVLNFPIKAFVSITMQLDRPAANGIRNDGVLEISRIKKDFDQIDRSLAVATSKYITYAFVKHGGLRIIRQDDGKDRHVFKNTHDRIFNVSICTAATNGPPSDDQAILGTGVSGAVYYATISKSGNDFFEKNELDTESLIFPAFPYSDENTAGGLLKTRAKRSSRHPEFFAIGRGKFINLIWPAVALSPPYGVSDSNRRVDIEKLFRERALQISTGKAGKDFVFSEDDTMIVSLDKTGRLRFWDIRKLTEEFDTHSARVTRMTVDTPSLSLMTASPAERSWPTSVLFVDKARPYAKGGALRYVLVGLRQNHTLQLWDIALGKAVQEINFPHESEVDGICSVNYHPGSGIIVVGHPTRNSLFFIHLSAPRYTLSSSLNQAAYVQRVAAKDPDIPKPESTACMSGVRELSFTGRGQLRSVELLNVQKAADKSVNTDDGQVLFELYVVHSKGVTCIGINKEDLGWNQANKVIASIDSEKEGLITLKELKLGSVIEEPIREGSPAKEVPQPIQTSRSSRKKPKKQKDVNEDETNTPDENQASTAPAITSVTPEAALTETNTSDLSKPKESKKSKQKASQATVQSNDQPIPSSGQDNDSDLTKDTIDSQCFVNTKASSPMVQDPAHHVKPEALSMSISGDWLDRELKKIERGVSAEFKKEFDLLYQNIQRDRTLQDQSSASRQEAVLRLVSSSLNNNVEKSLARILATQMHEVAVPSVTQSVTTQLTDSIMKNLVKAIPQSIETSLPSAIHSVMDATQISKVVAETLSHKLSLVCQRQITTMFNESLAPALRDSLSAAISTAVIATEGKLAAQIDQLQMQNNENKQKMEKMSLAMESMASTLRTMSETQVAFQNQILKDRHESATIGAVTSTLAPQQTSSTSLITSRTSNSKVTSAKVKTKAEIELDEVAALMEQRKYEEGSIKWLQSSQPVKLFDDLFVKFTPEYLSSDVSPLVAFSIAVTVANTLLTNTKQRLEWIAAAFDAVDFQDQEIIELSEHAPQLVGSMIQKLESLYMSLAERNNREPLLQLIPPVAKKARDLRATFQAVYDQSKG